MRIPRARDTPNQARAVRLGGTHDAAVEAGPGTGLPVPGSSRILSEEGCHRRPDLLVGFVASGARQTLVHRGMPQRLAGAGIVQIHRNDAFVIDVGVIPAPTPGEPRPPAWAPAPAPAPAIAIAITVGIALDHVAHADPVTH